MDETAERCSWPGDSALLIDYHDQEWAVPVHDDRKLFELLILEGAQAGLTWRTVLNKRENYRKAFDNFQPARIARYSQEDVGRLLDDPGIIRNRLKVTATVQNAKAFLEAQREFGTFDSYIWRFVRGRPISHNIGSARDIAATTTESDAMSRDLLKRGFKFVGSTICYAFMQATGMVNDHETRCFRYKDLSAPAAK